MSGNRDNSGTFSKNKRKEKDTHPDITGSLMAGGVAYWLSGWQKSNENGTYYSVSLKPKDEPKPAQTKSQASGLDDEVPF